MSRQYFSVRAGRRPPTIDLAIAKRLFLAVFEQLETEYHWQELLGYDCVDEGPVNGLAGSDPAAFVLLRTHRADLWPVSAHVGDWDEPTFFDAVEFLFDHVSQGTRGELHSFMNCGWHYVEFDRAAGRQRFRSEMNPILTQLGAGWELTERGEIVRRVDAEVKDLLDRALPATAEAGIQERVTAAARKFRDRGSDRDARRDAVRDLADILERLRPSAKEVLSKKDDAMIFELANKFGIRHWNEQQLTDYDPIWLSWMFHFYLATIHAVTRLLDARGVATKTPAGPAGA